MFESEGKRAEIQLPPGKWYAADMLEQNYEPVAGKIIFKPFEIKTLLSVVSEK